MTNPISRPRHNFLEADDIIKFQCDDLSVRFGQTDALRGINMDIPDKSVTALIGASGCGKSTLLRVFNRMNETRRAAQTTGSVRLNGHDIYQPGLDPVLLRMRVGMVFQKPNPFPSSIFDNVAFGVRIHGLAQSRIELEAHVRQALISASLWEQVKDRLHESALSLSGGQQQRLVLARTLAVDPEVILMDEPASSLDPIATTRLEALIESLKARYCIIIVTHSMSQAARISDQTAYLQDGALVEYDRTDTIFTNPKTQQTQDYITGRMG